VLIATWTKELDRAQLSAALSGRSPFDETTMLDEHDLQTDDERPEPNRAHAPDLQEADAPRELVSSTAAR
jgi:aerobic C4-dicarboxylate transport protein